MRTQALLFCLTLSLAPLAAMAGAGHDHGHSHDHGHAHDAVTQGKAEEIAAKNVARLADSGKIDKSWKTVRAVKSEKKDFSGSTEWVVEFKNDKISEPDRQTLYVFLSLGGEYIAANFTGK
ncbi:MAG: DUF6488 family protein [Pseudomonadota bacterium]